MQCALIIVHITFTPSIYLTDSTMRVNESSLSTKACDWLTLVCRQERGGKLRGWNRGRNDHVRRDLIRNAMKLIVLIEVLSADIEVTLTLKLS